MSILLFLAAAHAIAVAGPLTFHSEASIQGDIVRLSDVADLSALPASLRDRTAGTPVARVQSREQVVSSRAIARRARAAVPVLSAWLPEGAEQFIRVRSIEAVEPARAVAPIATPPSFAISAGDAVTLRTQVGPVVVEREVTALQAARPGHSVFVRTADGVALSARLARPR